MDGAQPSTLHSPSRSRVSFVESDCSHRIWQGSKAEPALTVRVVLHTPVSKVVPLLSSASFKVSDSEFLLAPCHGDGQTLP